MIVFNGIFVLEEGSAEQRAGCRASVYFSFST